MSDVREKDERLNARKMDTSMMELFQIIATFPRDVSV